MVGRRRFKIQQSWEQDGYRVAAPQFFADEAPPAGSPEAAELAVLAGAVESRAELWVDKVKCAALIASISKGSASSSDFPGLRGSAFFLLRSCTSDSSRPSRICSFLLLAALELARMSSMCCSNGSSAADALVVTVLLLSTASTDRCFTIQAGHVHFVTLQDMH